MTTSRFRMFTPGCTSAACLAVFLLFGFMADASEKNSSEKINPDLTKVGDAVPSFEVKTLEGKVFNIQQLKGQVVFLNFFATWCPPCIAEMPRLEKEVWQKNKTGKLAFLSVGREETEEIIKNFARKQGLSFPFASDPKRAIFSLFATQTIPRNYIINRAGKIVFQSSGYSAKEFQEMLKILAAELKNP